MGNLKQFAQTAREIWDRWTASQRTLVLSATVLSVLTVVGVGYWSTRPELVILASRLTPDQASEAIAQLEAAGISYDLGYSGSTISVPRKDMNRARLAVRESLGDQASEDTLEDSIWADPNLQHVRIQRQQEQRLAKSIARFTAVREAIVHITSPQPSPFVRQKTPATASVVIELKPGAAVSGRDAEAIISLVSHSVEGLRPEDVSLMDTTGRLLSSNHELSGDVGGQLEYVSSLETHLASKAEALLSQMLGVGRSMVRVTADVDFTVTERQETTYDPSTKVKRSETTKSESHNGISSGGGGGGGPAGTSSNVSPSSSVPGANAVKIEENTTEYANTEIRDTVKETPGRIKRLTVAVVVDLNAAEGGTAPVVNTTDVESLVKQAVGFDDERSDKINVVSAALTGVSDASGPAVPLWETYGPLARTLSLGLAAVLMFALGLLLLRKLRPVVVGSAESESEESMRRLAELSFRARQHPELVAKVLQTWLDEDAPSAAPATPSTSRRATA